jgi:PAS domain S-box-containing protein
MDTVAGYAVIKDIEGNNALVLQITQPRDIYRQGIYTTLEFILILLAAWLGFGIFTLFILDRLVLSRIDAISMQVHAIGRQADSSRRVSLTGDDELSELTAEINRMLGTLENTQKGFQLSEARFRDLAELLPQIIFEIDTDANITFVNKFGLELFGLTEKMLKDGLNARQVMIPEDIERMFYNLKKRAAGEKPSGETYRLIKKDKSIVQTILIASPIIHDGRLEGFRGSGIDITERIRLEDALTESEEYLQTLIKSIHVGIFVIDATTHVIIDANPVALRMIGSTKDAVINKPCHQVICPAEVGRCPITDLHRRVDNAERTLLTRDGREISIIKYVVPLTLHGKPCLLETFIDNTYRKQIELKLAESEEKYRTLTENTGDILFSADIRGFVTYVSPQVGKYGFILPDIIGKPLLNFVHPDDRSKVMDNLSRELLEGAQFTSTFRVLDKNGKVHWFEENSSLRKDTSGNPLGIYGVLRDITERKKVEEALVKSEEKYRAITENTPDILFSADLYGIVTFVSPQVNRYGYLADEIVGQPLFNNIHPEDRRNVIEKFKSDLHDGAQFISTFRFQDKWGNNHWFEEKSSLLLDQFGKPVGINGILRDVTEQKRAEDAIELANKKLNLMNNITRHDILNTITGLVGCVDMANATTSPEERNHLLNDIKALTRVIQRQINFTKQYQEVGVHLPLWQNLTDVIQRVLVNFEKSGLLFVIEVEKTEIYADPLLEKVFYNLVDNAIRYGEKATTLKFYFLISDQGLSLICEDDGVGVPENFKNYIFERGMGQNTGMGLFLSREILSITKIGIRENGIPGKGARFEMLVPRGTFRFTR